LAGISDDERTLLMTLLTKMRANLTGREAAIAAA